jgi:thioredoxin reductase (NADPH)
VTNKGTIHNAKVVAIAGGLGSFEPRKPAINNIEKFEGKGLEYLVKDPEIFKNKNVVISGGGDSALDWTIELEKIAKKVTLIHRRTEFRGAIDSVDKVQNLKNKSLIDVITPAEVIALNGMDNLKSLIVKIRNTEKEINTDFFIPLFGLIPKLGKIGNWGLKIEKNSICVNNALDYQTNIPGVFAIGDVNTYPGKLKLILCGFHEATLMCQAAFKIIYPKKKNILRYTTVAGVNGFDGSKRKSESAIIKSIE